MASSVKQGLSLGYSAFYEWGLSSAELALR